MGRVLVCSFVGRTAAPNCRCLLCNVLATLLVRESRHKSGQLDGLVVGSLRRSGVSLGVLMKSFTKNT